MTSSPRIAIAHDFLSQHGGAERVVLRFASMFPDAPIFTAFHDPGGTFPEFRSLDVRTSSLQERVDPARFRRQVLRYPAAFREFDLSAFDAVLVSSSAFAHHLQHPNTLVYCHTPPRFLYAPHTYVNGRARALANVAIPALLPLRRRDARAARAAAGYVANSERTAARVRRLYGIDCPVIPPPIATDHLPRQLTALPGTPRALVVSRLMPYKRVDLAVEACRRAGIPLTVVGEGPEREALAALGGDTTTFLGRVDDDTLRREMARTSVVLVPGAEDFGLLPLEANYAGRPVVAFAGGGPRETVQDGVTGLLVDDQEVGSWEGAVTTAVGRSWDPRELRASTAAYSAARFEAAVSAWMSRVTGLEPAGTAPVHEIDLRALETEIAQTTGVRV